jgi:hypothetical protein
MQAPPSVPQAAGGTALPESCRARGARAGASLGTVVPHRPAPMSAHAPRLTARRQAARSPAVLGRTVLTTLARSGSWLAWVRGLGPPPGTARDVRPLLAETCRRRSISEPPRRPHRGWARHRARGTSGRWIGWWAERLADNGGVAHDRKPRRDVHRPRDRRTLRNGGARRDATLRLRRHLASNWFCSDRTTLIDSWPLELLDDDSDDIRPDEADWMNGRHRRAAAATSESERYV